MTTSTSKMRRAAHGLDCGPDGTDWRTRAACALDPELWWSGRVARDRVAVHICRHHCPVLAQCGRDAQRVQPCEGVQAGVVWVGTNREAKPALCQPAPLGHGAHCDRWSRHG